MEWGYKVAQNAEFKYFKPVLNYLSTTWNMDSLSKLICDPLLHDGAVPAALKKKCEK